MSDQKRESDLSASARERVEALRVARELLGPSGSGGLIHVATWIVEGSK